MSTNSTIEWTDKTWNPTKGCERISKGCDNCYAVPMSLRQAGMAKARIGRGEDPGLSRHYMEVTADGDWNGKVVAAPETLGDPFTWSESQAVFVNSMSDLFHKDAPADFVERVCRVMQRADWHIYQVLTKRSSIMRNKLQGPLRFASELPHVWWGVSVENKSQGLPRIEHLRQAPAAVRFLSVEPLLEDLGEVNLDGIHWVIVGGESGQRARPMREEWVLSIREQCERAGVPFFFKQWGTARKKEAGRLLQGKTYDAMPPMIGRPVPDRKQRMAWLAEVAPESQPELIQIGMPAMN